MWWLIGIDTVFTYGRPNGNCVNLSMSANFLLQFTISLTLVFTESIYTTPRYLNKMFNPFSPRYVILANTKATNILCRPNVNLPYTAVLIMLWPRLKWGDHWHHNGFYCYFDTINHYINSSCPFRKDVLTWTKLKIATTYWPFLKLILLNFMQIYESHLYCYFDCGAKQFYINLYIIKI